MDENLKTLLWAFYSLGRNDESAPWAGNFTTPIEDFEAALDRHDWSGVRLYRE